METYHLSSGVPACSWGNPMAYCWAKVLLKSHFWLRVVIQLDYSRWSSINFGTEQSCLGDVATLCHRIFVALSCCLSCPELH